MCALKPLLLFFFALYPRYGYTFNTFQSFVFDNFIPALSGSRILELRDRAGFIAERESCE